MSLVEKQHNVVESRWIFKNIDLNLNPGLTTNFSCMNLDISWFNVCFIIFETDLLQKVK